MMVLSVARAQRLKPLLDAFRDTRDFAARVSADPVEFPHRYRDPRDIEVVGLLSAALAYGRVELFKPKIAGLLDRLGPGPAVAMAELTVASAARLLEGFVYRFNVAADLAVLFLGIGATLQRYGSLEACFVSELEKRGSWRSGLQGFVREIRGLRPSARLSVRWAELAASRTCCQAPMRALPSGSTCTSGGWCAGPTSSISASGRECRRLSS